MWAKNSTPSPGFLEESLAQNRIPQREQIEGEAIVILALSSDPLGPSSHPSEVAADTKCTGQLGKGGRGCMPCRVGPGYAPGPRGGLLGVCDLRFLLCLAAEGRAHLHLPEHAALDVQQG